MCINEIPKASVTENIPLGFERMNFQFRSKETEISLFYQPFQRIQNVTE
jgi:hypothetical protein